MLLQLLLLCCAHFQLSKLLVYEKQRPHQANYRQGFIFLLFSYIDSVERGTYLSSKVGIIPTTTAASLQVLTGTILLSRVFFAVKGMTALGVKRNLRLN